MSQFQHSFLTSGGEVNSLLIIGQLNFFVDGFLCNTFSSRAAVEYVCSLLKKKSITDADIRWTLDEHFSCVISVSSGAPSHQSLSQQPVIDRQYIRYPSWNFYHWNGRTIEQDLWKPDRRSSRSTNVRNAALRLPFWFMSEHGFLGIPLADALNESAASPRYQLRGAHTYAFAEAAPRRSTTFLRVKLKGQPNVCQRQIRLIDTKKEPITFARLALEVGRFVQLLFREAQQGKHDVGGMHQNQIVLIGLVHVSAGSWQPLLLCSDDTAEILN